MPDRNNRTEVPNRNNGAKVPTEITVSIVTKNLMAPKNPIEIMVPIPVRNNEDEVPIRIVLIFLHLARKVRT